MRIKSGALGHYLAKYGIPNGWRPVEVRDLADIVGGATPDTTEPSYWESGTIPWISPSDLTSQNKRILTNSARKITEAGFNACSCNLLPPGAIVFTARGTIGALAIAGVPLTTNQTCENLIPRAGVDSDFLYYLLSFLRPVFQRLGAGTTFMSVTRDDIGVVQCAVPEEREQKEIAAILKATDELIEKTEAKLLAARRLKTALLQQLFTHGLPGRHTQFQETKWVRCPASWEIKPLGQLAGIESGFTMGRDLTGHELVSVPYLTVVNVQAGRIDLSSVVTVEVKASEVEDLLLKPGDVVMTEGGDRDKLGRGCIWRGEIDRCVYQNHIFRIRFRPQTYLPELFHFLLQSWEARNYFAAHAKQTSNLCSINKRELRRFPVPIPKPDEQEEMLSLLSAADANIEAIEREVEALGRLKRSLLQNLLTGKVRVKGENSIFHQKG